MNISAESVATYLVSDLTREFRDAEELDLHLVQDYLEKITLPLRLGTPARIMLDALAAGRMTLTDRVATGSSRSDPEPYGPNLFVTLNDEECNTLDRGIVQLTYSPQYALPLVHYINADYQATASEIGLNYFLALETMFDPGGRERGRADRVSNRASTFGATSVQQRRQARAYVRTAYVHRGALRHGESEVQRLETARQWFGEHLIALKTIAAVAFQRVLRLSASAPNFDLQGRVAAIESNKRAALNQVLNFPVF